MRAILASILLFVTAPVLAAGPGAWEVSCDKGVDIAKVQALVKRTVEALKKDQVTVLREINRGDPKWKDGDYYMVVLQGTKILAHGYIPSAVGFDAGTPAGERMYPWIREGQRIVMERGEDCVQYDFMNPAKGGLVEHKVTYFTKVNGAVWAGSGTYLVRK